MKKIKLNKNAAGEAVVRDWWQIKGQERRQGDQAVKHLGPAHDGGGPGRLTAEGEGGCGAQTQDQGSSADVEA